MRFPDLTATSPIITFAAGLQTLGMRSVFAKMKIGQFGDFQ